MVCGQSPQQTLATKSEKLAYKDHWGRLTILTRNRSVKERLQVVWFPRLLQQHSENNNHASHQCRRVPSFNKVKVVRFPTFT